MPDPNPAANRPLWLPNALVWVRLALAAAFVAMLSPGVLESRARLLGAAAVFIVAAVTDALDGHLARRWNAITRFGRVMDPFADKILVLGAFVCLAGPAFHVDDHPDVPALHASGIYPWMVVLILGRELLVTTLRGLIEGEGGDFSAVRSGKLKMIAQSVAIPAILLLLAIGSWDAGEWGRWLIDLLAWATTLLTVASGYPYVQRALRAQP